MSKPCIHNVTVSALGDTITYEFVDGTKKVVALRNEHMTKHEPLSHMIATAYAAILELSEKVEALETYIAERDGE